MDCYEEVTTGPLIGHLRQVFHVDMQVAGFVSLEGAVLGFWRCGLEIAQVSYPVAAQAAVQPGT